MVYGYPFLKTKSVLVFVMAFRAAGVSALSHMFTQVLLNQL